MFCNQGHAIEEAKDITILRFDELIGSLKTIELNLEEKKCDKLWSKNNISFNVQHVVQTKKKAYEVIDKIKIKLIFFQKILVG